MPIFNLLIPLFGLLLCLLALTQLGLWAAQSLRINSQNNRQFELAKQLMRDQIRQQTDQPVKDSKPSPVPNPQPRTPTQAIAPATQGLNTFRQLKVIKLIDETPACRSVYLQPVDGRPCQDFLAGQHLPIRFTIPGQAKPVIRCYSLSNAAGEGVYRISVKAIAAPTDPPGLPAGLVSNFVNQQLKVGDVVEAKSPAGSFTLQHNSKATIVMLAGGIGITPMVSMIQEAILKNVQRPMVLIYGVTNRNDQAFREWLDQEAQAHENLMLVSCFSKPLESEVQGVDYQVPGHVTIDLLKQILPSPDCQFYLCGPPAFMESLSTGLDAWGVKDDQIFSEAFGPATRKPRPQINPSSLTSSNAATIRFSQANVSVNHDGTSSILEMSESVGVAMDSGCRAGSCETCLAKITRGAVSYPNNETPNVGPNECLPCIAVPAGDVELEI